MIVKALKKFGDKTTGATYAEQKKIEAGTVFECDDELANERIQNGLVKKASKKEAKEYVDSLETLDESDLNQVVDSKPADESKENNNDENEKPVDPEVVNPEIINSDDVTADELEGPNGPNPETLNDNKEDLKDTKDNNDSDNQ